MFYTVKAFDSNPCAGQVKALLHMNGTDASTTFTDVFGHTWTAHGNAQIDTAQSKFGGASGLFDGSGDWIDTPDSTDWTIGSGDLTIEFWLMENALGALQWICGQGNNLNSNATSPFGMIKNATDQIEWRLSDGTSSFSASNTTVLTTGQWYHVAGVKQGITMYVFVDGVKGSNATAPTSLVDSASVFSIGRWGAANTNYFNGWVDDFRFSRCARYTANFTPPSAELPDTDA